MTNKTHKIYSVTQPPIEKEINSNELEIYLNCKFWKYSRKEALLFLYSYAGPTQHESIDRVIGIITGELFALDSPDSFFAQLNFTEKYKSLLGVIDFDKTYPHYHLIDDVIKWARTKELMQEAIFQNMQQEISTVRSSVFKSEPSENVRIDTLKLVLDKGFKFILYEDIAEILSLNTTVYTKIKEAVEKKEIHFAFHSINKKIYYFEPASLLKWLMKYGHFPENWIAHFKEIKVESIKETTSPTPKTFTLNQLQNWLEKNHPEDVDIFYHVNSNIYHAYIHAHDSSFWIYSKQRYPNQKHPPYKIKFQHLERLLSPANDKTNSVIYLLNGSTIIAGGEYSNYVEVAVTDDEYKYGLSKLFILRNKDMPDQLCSADLRFIVDEVKDGIKKYKQVQSTASKSGGKSGEVRRENRDKIWSLAKPKALKAAIDYEGESINKIAGIIKERGIIESSIRTIARYIEADPSFKPYYKINK